MSWLEKRFGSSEHLPVVLIILLGLALRLIWLVVAEPVPMSDYIEYKWLGENILDHQRFGHPQPNGIRLPGYPGFLALLMLVSRSNVWLSLCNVLLSTGLIFALYLLARRLSDGNQVLANTSALICAIYPAFIFYSPVLASEHFSVLLFLGGLLVLLTSDSERVPPIVRAIIAGSMIGLAILTRGENLFYLPVYLLAIFFSQGTLRARAIRSALVVVCLLVVIAPWYVRNQQVFGPGIGLAASSGFAFYFSHNRYEYNYSDANYNPDLIAPTLEESSRLGWKKGIEYLLEDPMHVFRRMPLALSRLYGPGNVPYTIFWGSVKLHAAQPGGWVTTRQEIPGLELLDALCKVVYVFVMALAALSIAFWRTLPIPALALPWTLILANGIGYGVIFYSMDRYRFSVEVVACLLAAITVGGLTPLLQRLRTQSAPSEP